MGGRKLSHNSIKTARLYRLLAAQFFKFKLEISRFIFGRKSLYSKQLVRRPESPRAKTHFAGSYIDYLLASGWFPDMRKENFKHSYNFWAS